MADQILPEVTVHGKDNFIDTVRGIEDKLFFIRTAAGHGGFSITDFRSHLAKHNEVAKDDKFMAKISVPHILQGSPFTSRDLALQCEMAELPGITINPINYKIYSIARQLPLNMTFQPLNLTFYVDGDMKLKRFFDLWMSRCIQNGRKEGRNGIIYDEKTGLGENDNYKTKIIIEQFDPTGAMIYDVVFREAWPIAMSALPLNWSSGQVHKLTVTFSYYIWEQNQFLREEANAAKDTLVQKFGGQEINKLVNFTSSLVSEGKDVAKYINAADNIKPTLKALKSQKPTTGSVAKALKSIF